MLNKNCICWYKNINIIKIARCKDKKVQILFESLYQKQSLLPAVTLWSQRLGLFRLVC